MSSDGEILDAQAAPVPETGVSVRVEETDSDAPDDIFIVFEFRSQYPRFAANFSVTEPLAIPLSEWRDLASGKATLLNLYQGNGEGTIHSDGEEATFTSMPSGAGGDVIGVIEAKVALFSAALVAAVNEMERRGQGRNPPAE
jgi:hypothetical protein